jgi:hypothetical protein
MLYEIVVELLMLRSGLSSSHCAVKRLDGGCCGICVLRVVGSNSGRWPSADKRERD